MKKLGIYIAALLALLIGTAHAGDDPPRFKIAETDDGFLFTEGNTKVLFYQRKAKSLDGKFERANYIHPLYGLDGNVLTEDFPKDHPHQRGVYWAWHLVKIGDKKLGDGWAAREFSWDVVDANVLPTHEQSAALKVAVLWKSPHWADDAGQQKPFVRETTVIRVHRSAKDERKIDFDIRLLALEKNLKIGGAENEKGYGGFSLRVRLPKGTRFTGAVGDVSPRTGPVETGAWLDMTGAFGNSDAPSGFTVLGHPSLPGFPQPWVLRRGYSMQNAVYPGREPVELSTETPLVLRYRLVLHRGQANATRIESLQKEYGRQ